MGKKIVQCHLYYNNRLLTDRKPSCPIGGVINETQVFKEPVGHFIVLLYVAVDRVALSTDMFHHRTDQNFSIAFPSVLWQSVQQPDGTVIIHQNPGHQLAMLVCEAARREVPDEVVNVAVTSLVPSKFPGAVYHVNVGCVKR